MTNAKHIPQQKIECLNNIQFQYLRYIQPIVSSGSVDVIGAGMTASSSNAASCSFHYIAANHIGSMQSQQMQSDKLWMEKEALDG